mgnify:CR=1 FL=1
MIKEKDADVTVVKAMHSGSGRAFVHNFFKDNLDLGIFIHNTILELGSTIGFHKHEDSEEIYYVISGRGLMKVDDEEVEVGAGDAVLTKKGSSHGIRNIGNTNLRLLVIAGRV